MCINFRIVKSALIILFIGFFSILTYASEYFIYEEGGKQGLKNENNEIIVPAKFAKIGWTDSDFQLKGQVFGYFDQGLWGLMNIQNEILSAPEYEVLSVKQSGSYIIAGKAKNHGTIHRVGLIDQKGKTLIDFSFVRLEIYRDKVIAWYKEFDKPASVGMLNIQGQTIVPFEYLEIKPIGSLRYLLKTRDNKSILYNDRGEKVSDLELDSLAEFENGKAKFWVGHKMGLIDTDAQIILPPGYKDVKFMSDKIEALEFPMWEIKSIDSDSSRFYSYDKIESIDENKYSVTANAFQWIIDADENMLSEKAYQYIGEFINNHAVFRDGKYFGVIRSDGKLILPARKTEIYRENGFFVARNLYGKWDIYDDFGVKKNRIPYDSVGVYNRVFFQVKKGGFWGLIDRSGEELVYCVYDSLSDIKDDLIAVKFKGVFGIIDLKGNWVVTPNEYPKKLINDKIYSEVRNGQTHFRDFDGTLIYFTANEIKAYDNYLLEVLSNDKVWRISFSGVITADKTVDVVNRNQPEYSEFEAIYEPSEGFSAIKKDGKFGFIDDLNRLRIANRYDSAQSYSEGLAAVSLLGKWAYIDKAERIIIQPMYERADPFHDGLALVIYEGNYNLIDQNNVLRFKTGFEKMEFLHEGLYLISKNGKKGVVDGRGNIRINYVFDEIERLENGTYIIRKLGKMGMIDHEGLYIVPRDYDQLEYNLETGILLMKRDSQWLSL